jgi:hypothetical protein
MSITPLPNNPYRLLKGLFYGLVLKINELVAAVNLINKPYKVYSAILTQTGTNAPIATEFENTIGDITFSYLGEGMYGIVSDNLFINNKTQVFIGNFSNIFTTPTYLTSTSLIDISTIQVGTLTPANDIMQKMSIEIRVYN